MRYFLLVASVVLSFTQAGSAQISKVVLTSDLVPVRGGAQAVQSIYEADLNHQGQVAVYAQTVEGVDAIWLRGPTGELELVSQSGDVAPGPITNATFVHDNDETWVRINEQNELLFGSEAIANERFGGLWIATPDHGIQPVHQYRAPAFGFPEGSFLGDADSVTFTDGGVAITSTVRDIDEDRWRYAVYWWADGQYSLLATEGDIVPATPQDVSLRLPEHTNANRLGHLAVSDFGSTVSEPITPGMWLFTANSDQSPKNLLQGVDPSLIDPFEQFFAVFIADDETVYFDGGWSGGPQGIWKSKDAVVTPVIVQGDVLDEGTVTRILDFEANERGDVAFLARVEDGSREVSGIWRRVGDQTQLVAQQGISIPKTDGAFGTLTDLMANEFGQLAFEATTTSDGVRSVFAEDIAGNLTLVVDGNAPFDVGGGELRDLAGVSLADFNDQGVLLVDARFVDGSRGFFTIHTVAVPEPVGIAHMLLGLALAVAGTRRRFTSQMTCVLR